jgi:polyferredoxin
MRWRWALVFLTQLVFYGLPWLQWGSARWCCSIWGTALLSVRPGAVPAGFHLPGGSADHLRAGAVPVHRRGRAPVVRLRCPQTVYTEIFMWIEQKVEGERSARMRLDKGAGRSRRSGRNPPSSCCGSPVLWTGFTFVGYFVPIRELGVELLALQGGWQIFWVLFYGFATYGNAGYMREQVCKYMCPYARFQSAMFDKDT